MNFEHLTFCNSTYEFIIDVVYFIYQNVIKNITRKQRVTL